MIDNEDRTPGRGYYGFQHSWEQEKAQQQATREKVLRLRLARMDLGNKALQGKRTRDWSYLNLALLVIVGGLIVLVCRMIVVGCGG